VPAFAQHGGAHAGSMGGRGFSGTAGFSSHPAYSHPAFSQSPGFSRPAPQARYGPAGGFRTYGQPGLRSPYYGSRFAAGRPSINPRVAEASRNVVFDRARNQDRDRFDTRRRQFRNWYANTYPYWPGYPYLFDPNAYNLGLYDWSDADDSASDTSQPPGYEAGNYLTDPNVAAPDYLPPYPNQRPPYPAQQSAEAPAISSMPLTVIFKDGRSPIQVRNYLMTAKLLTDLDSYHYEQIPLEQIDLAATKRFNTFAGVDFQVPGA
jgi:hypothetical protein